MNILSTGGVQPLSEPCVAANGSGHPSPRLDAGAQMTSRPSSTLNGSEAVNKYEYVFDAPGGRGLAMGKQFFKRFVLKSC